MMKTIIHVLVLIYTLMSNDGQAACLNTKVSGQGQAILLMPGFISDERVWQPLANSLAKNYQVHQLSIAGFGKNPACEQAETIYPQVIAELKQYLNTTELDRPIFIGHSMGGLMAYELALADHSELVAAISIDGLPFIGPVFTRTNETTVEDISYQARSIKQLYQHANAKQLKMMTQQGIAIQTKDESRYQDILDMAETSDPVTAANAVYAVMTTDLRLELAKLKTPMLLIGASGGFTQPEQQQAIKTLYQAQLVHSKQIELKMNSRGRHFLMWDQPQWLIETITQFIKEQA
ncbi:alpha/beta hydrolase [Thalassotalea insulae]|uniref:Alpha/beta hydrolase n=1 Tax=Thalassotalea insulae TaxID=2056778 RepID=A0ABQ6GWN8_9GAMM|nr:alpha/beta hydrolase [Thalassotalea insulae]GLX79037.1 alpha/beta hydrolase [Thalassotalea insulae]